MAGPSLIRLAPAALILLAACGRQRSEATAPSIDTPVPSSSMTTGADRSRTWTWNQRISREECVMDDARLTMYDDGTYAFHALVQSRDNNDRWLVSFSFMDRDRVLLEGLHTSGVSFTMENANQRYRWVTSRTSDSGQPVDPSAARGARLGDIASVNIHAGC